MTNPTQGEWKQDASIIHCENGVICELSDPRKTVYIKHYRVEIGSVDWEEAMANGRLIIESVTCLRTIQLHANGLTWQEWLVKAETAIKVVDNTEELDE